MSWFTWLQGLIAPAHQPIADQPVVLPAAPAPVPPAPAPILTLPVPAAPPPAAVPLPAPASPPLPNLRAGLAAVAPRLSAADLEAWELALSDPMQRAGITTPRRIAAFLGQVAVESQYFTKLAEDLDYTHAERIMVEFPRECPTLAIALPCVGNPVTLANTVYANRMGNGPPASGDGWKFRGQGLIDITGKDNYVPLAAWVGKSLDDTAAWMQTKAGAAASACWWWENRNLNPLADAWSLTSITTIVTGGNSALQDRINLANAALSALG